MTYIALKNILYELSKDGKIFFYGSTALSHYFKNRNLKYIRVLTSLNIAELGKVISNLSFSKDYYFDCYTELDNGIIVTFLTNEIQENNDYKYLYNVLNEYQSNPLFIFTYSLNKDKYYLLNDTYYNFLKEKIFDINNPSNINIEDLLDLSLISSELDIKINLNNFDLFKDNKINIPEIKKYLPFLELVLTSKNPYNSLIFLNDIGLLQSFFPFLNDLFGIQQDRCLHPEGDVFDHTLHSFKFLKNPSLELAYGMLLHDYGKVFLKNQKNFKEHSMLGADKVLELLKPYGYSYNFINKVKFLVDYHMINSYFYRITDDEKKKLFDNELGVDLVKLFKADTLGSIGKLDNYYDIISKLKRISKLY